MAKPADTPGNGGTKGGGKDADTSTSTHVGTEGADVMICGDGDDIVTSFAGDDTLVGGNGNDVLDGGEGSDTYIASGYEGVDTYLDTGTEGWDVLVAGEKATIFYMAEFGPESGIEEINGGGFGGVDIRGTSGANVLDFSSTVVTGIQYINGLGGDDVINGSQGDDQLLGSGGNDVLNGEGGTDYLYGGSGSDTFVLDDVHDAGDIVVDFVDGADRLDISGLLADADYAGHALVQDGADTVVRVTLADGSTNDVATLMNVDAASLGGADLILA